MWDQSRKCCHQHNPSDPLGCKYCLDLICLDVAQQTPRDSPEWLAHSEIWGYGPGIWVPQQPNHLQNSPQAILGQSTVCFSVATISQPQPGDPDFEEDPDGPDYDDDYAINLSILCNIRTSSATLLANIVDYYGDLAYTGDEELTDDDADGETDIACMDAES